MGLRGVGLLGWRGGRAEPRRGREVPFLFCYTGLGVMWVGAELLGHWVYVLVKRSQ
jgi:hypothetical protein